MATEKTTSSRNAAYVADSPASYECVKASLVVSATVGTCSIYGPPVGGNVTTPVIASTAIGALRPGYRMAIMRVTGGVGAGGTYTAMIVTFKTITIVGTTGTVGGIIARWTTVVDASATAGWVFRDAVANVPLCVSDPGCGIQMSVAAAGSDGTIAMEFLLKMVKVETPST